MEILDLPASPFLSNFWQYWNVKALKFDFCCLGARTRLSAVGWPVGEPEQRGKSFSKESREGGRNKCCLREIWGCTWQVSIRIFSSNEKSSI